MSQVSQILDYIKSINEKLNLWTANAKKIEELPVMDEMNPSGLLMVSELVSGIQTSKQLEIQKIIDAVSLAGQNNTVREVLLGSITFDHDLNYLFDNAGITVTESELVILSALQTVNATVIQRQFVWKLGKGNFQPIGSVNLNSKVLELQPKYINEILANEMQTAPDAIVYEFGVITNPILTVLNTASPARNYSDLEKIYYIRATQDDVNLLYNFVGSAGIYGNGALQMTESDLVLVYSSSNTDFTSLLSTKLDKGTYTGTAQSLKQDIDNLFITDTVVRTTEPTRVGNTFTFPVNGYEVILNKIRKANVSEFITTIVAATDDYKRTDLIYFKPDNTLDKVQGEQDLSLTKIPEVPVGCIGVLYINIYGSTIEMPTVVKEKLSDFIDDIGAVSLAETTASILTKIGDGITISQAYLPSYVDDILEFANLSAFPAMGEIGKIYIALSPSSKQYRWSGSAYVQITNGLIASTNDVPEGTNLYFTASRVLATVLTGISSAIGTAVVASDTVLQAIGKLQKQITDNSASIIVWIKESLVSVLPSKTTLTDTDNLLIGDNADSDKTKKISWLNFKTLFKTVGGTSIFGTGDIPVSGGGGGVSLSVANIWSAIQTFSLGAYLVNYDTSNVYNFSRKLLVRSNPSNSNAQYVTNPVFYDFVAGGDNDSPAWQGGFNFVSRNNSSEISLMKVWAASGGTPKVVINGDLTVGGIFAQAAVNLVRTSDLILNAPMYNGLGYAMYGGSSSPYKVISHYAEAQAGSGWHAKYQFWVKSNNDSTFRLAFELQSQDNGVPLIKAPGIFKPNQLDLSALGSYANDSAAATGGVPVGYGYINSSTGGVQRRLT